jgi:hypothetical protein
MSKKEEPIPPQTADTPPPDPVLLTVIYDSGLDERIQVILAELNVEGWTRIEGAHGYGGTGYRLDTPVWPGTNNLLLLALPGPKATMIAAELRTLQASYRRKPGITMWIQPIQLP